MMLVHESRTVRELAVAIPGATLVFETMGIDYCCGGHKLLHEACSEAGVDVDSVVSSLSQLERGSGSATRAVHPEHMTAGPLVNYILETHHTFTRDVLREIGQLVPKVLTKHSEQHPNLRDVERLFCALSDDLGGHMFKEENILFPFIAGLDSARAAGGPPPIPPFGTVENPIRVMMQEHDTAGDILRKLRKATNDYTPPPDACTSFLTLYQRLEALERDLHQHIHLENNVLFPLALELEGGDV
jgi:regulator of cell morphogenesis and NO signaling